MYAAKAAKTLLWSQHRCSMALPLTCSEADPGLSTINSIGCDVQILLLSWSPLQRSEETLIGLRDSLAQKRNFPQLLYLGLPIKTLTSILITNGFTRKGMAILLGLTPQVASKYAIKIEDGAVDGIGIRLLEDSPSKVDTQCLLHVLYGADSVYVL